MRVLHVTYGLDFGGVEAHLTTLARTRGSRYEHHFCALKQGGAAAGAIRAAGAEVAVLGVDPWKKPSRALRLMTRHLRELRPAVVHAHGLDGNLVAMAAGWFSRVPARIAEEIGIPEHALKTRLAVKVAYAMASRVIAVSRSVQNAILQAGEAPARKIVQIYNPVELPSAEAVPRNMEEPLRIAFVGRLEPVKNARSLVEAMLHLPADIPCRLFIVGDGSERPAIQQFIRAHGLQDTVTLTGFEANPNTLLASCHLYVQPSRTEGLGIALIEAMGCGLPALATARGGMAEIVEDGVNGWLIASSDPRDIAAAIDRAARLHPLQLADIGKAARRSVEDRFDPASYLQAIEILYDACLAR